MEKETIIDLMRHGEPEGGTLIRGWQDDPLSETGWSQMREAVSEPASWDRIISSPLTRCFRFAEELSEKLDLSLSTEDRLREIGFGEWEGRLPAELYEEHPEAISNFWRDPVKHTPPGAEPLEQFKLRVEAAWEDILSRHQGEHLLVVAHGGVNRLIIANVLGIPLVNLFRMEIPFAGISRLRIGGGIPRLVFHCGSDLV
ncbi:histidine phosphatase family protein [Solemya velesiana gill symbiont]|uniref:Histidine phosphatase family protein n=1 Tax=Solemya velesiana gill symbiont TaxID=1918948 RepID=A0A1T2KTE0_9GAMM|nr:alpha-ribazole phosphatase family protein [Solemya velesiana gill symbiont]OOZ36061.1 histidine phosphatase family protein [Solemya velesiana gill symbiont]